VISWWKIVGVALVLYAFIWGLLTPVPNLAILEQSIRNLFYHVTMWFAMILLLLGSLIQAIKYLSKGNVEADIKSAELATVALVFGLVGIVTGMIWAKNTWGTYWTNDPKLNSAAIGILMYLAYMVLRSSIEDTEKRARVSAVYNIICFPAFLVLVFILPRLTESLHPGNGGNPGFSSYDLDAKLRVIFYPAVIGFTLIGYWMAQLGWRIKLIEFKQTEQ
jgi:heme exporter protein C